MCFGGRARPPAPPLPRSTRCVPPCPLRVPLSPSTADGGSETESRSISRADSCFCAWRPATAAWCARALATRARAAARHCLFQKRVASATRIWRERFVFVFSHLERRARAPRARAPKRSRARGFQSRGASGRGRELRQKRSARSAPRTWAALRWDADAAAAVAAAAVTAPAHWVLTQAHRRDRCGQRTRRHYARRLSRRCRLGRARESNQVQALRRHTHSRSALIHRAQGQGARYQTRTAWIDRPARVVAARSRRHAVQPIRTRANTCSVQDRARRGTTRGRCHRRAPSRCLAPCRALRRHRPRLRVSTRGACC